MSKTLKKTLSIIIAILMIVTTVPFAFAADSGTCGDNVTWTLDSDGVLTISGTGDMMDYFNASDNPFYNNYDIKTVVIKDGVTSIGVSAFESCKSLVNIKIGNSVTSIGDYAFSYCKSLANITIPDSVTSIGDSAFKYCTSLENITVDEDNEYYSSENGVLFNKDKTTLIQYLLGNTETLYTIPDGVTSIGDYAFYYCTSLASIEIPKSVTSIGRNAFQGCSVLDNITVDEDNEYYSSENGVLFNKDKTTLIQYPIGNSRTTYTIPDSVTSIGEQAFWYCKSLASITIPDGVTSIGDYAFCGCTSLASIEIPDSVTSIGDCAFYNCTSLASITIPDGVTSIGSYAFDYTACYNDENNWENGVLYIGNHLIAAEYDISGNYSVKSGTKTIAGYAFSWCESLASVTIPDGVTSIGDYAFSWCESLASIEIPDSVTSIGDCAFYNCTSLESITISDSVTSIGDYAFCGCTSLKNITVNEGNESYSTENGVLFDKNKTTLIQYPAGNSRTTYKIPDSVTSISESAFADCTSLASVTIGNSVTSIGESAFYGCTSLESIIIPAGVTSIDNYVFLGCTSLASVTIPDSVTSIGKSAFLGCTSLASIEIPDSVTSIVDWAFYNCTSLTLVHYLGTSEQWDGIEIGSYGNDELTGATRHYCTEVEATVTCTEDGYTTGWYCSDCEEYIVGGEETAALGHVDANGDYICDYGCGHEFEKPVDPTPDTPDTPDEPTDNVCEDCGKVHTNFFSEIICFFTRIINFIKNLFA